jgi:hypothetical protein
MGADRSNADDPRWVTPWGRLLLREMLDAAQRRSLWNFPRFAAYGGFELDFACLFSGLSANSLELRAGNFSTRSREFIVRSRE